MDKHFYVDISRGVVIGIDAVKNKGSKEKVFFKTQIIPTVDFSKIFDKNHELPEKFWEDFAKFADKRDVHFGDVNYENTKKLFVKKAFARNETGDSMRCLMAHINIKDCLELAYERIYSIKLPENIFNDARKIPLAYTKMKEELVDYDCQFVVDLWDKSIKYYWNDDLKATKKFENIFRLNRYLLQLEPQDIKF